MTLPARAALGTMHGKEAALGPPLAALGISLIRPEIDTDRFGAFSAETPRHGTMVDAARAKARAAIAATGLNVGIASEGSDGPHPSIPFLPLGQKVLFRHEAETGHEIIEQAHDDRPTYDHAEVVKLAEAKALLAHVAFPVSATVLAPSADDRPVLARLVPVMLDPALALQTVIRTKLITAPAVVVLVPANNIRAGATLHDCMLSITFADAQTEFLRYA